MVVVGLVASVVEVGALVVVLVVSWSVVEVGVFVVVVGVVVSVVEERISDLEDRMVEISAVEQKKKE